MMSLKKKKMLWHSSLYSVLFHQIVVAVALVVVVVQGVPVPRVVQYRFFVVVVALHADDDPPLCGHR